MNKTELREILASLQNGTYSLDEAVSRLKWLPFDELVEANVDSHRQLRTGQPEVVYAEGKSTAQLREIIKSVNNADSDALLTRLNAESATELEKDFANFRYYAKPRVGISFVRNDQEPLLRGLGNVAVISAGTSDKPVAEEAALTAWVLGATVSRVYDVGVAGLHRLQTARPALEQADCIVVVAGMEGALASVVGGLTDKPVIATPTSVGYGASFSGIAALLGMLNSCASGVTVVNIDNGFGAGAAAAKIARLAVREEVAEGNERETMRIGAK